jgi:ParB-like chromosome segregation protein Spo0J
MHSQAMAQRIEHRKLAELTPYPRNPRRHSDAQLAAIAGSIAAFGFNCPILVDSKGGILAGHGRYLASLKLGLDTVPVVVLDHLSETEKRAYILADNKLAELSSFDDDLVRAELAELRDAEIDLGGLGFSDDELRVLLADADRDDGESGADGEEEIPEVPAEPVTRTGDLWSISEHRLVCGDCRDRSLIEHLFAGAKANIVITSPPYATQREYDPSSGFTPVPLDKYADWFRAVAANIAAVLETDGSYLLNIKEHAEVGQRSLYVKDLVVAHVRQWGWWFIDDFWRHESHEHRDVAH